MRGSFTPSFSTAKNGARQQVAAPARMFDALVRLTFRMFDHLKVRRLPRARAVVPIIAHR
jgi:hypothetical protein